MGRKKLTPPPEIANPLQRMLGTYLRLERVRLGRSSDDVATKLGLTDTFLRLTESGRAALNQSLIFRIIELYADTSSPTHETRSISFRQLAIYMVATHWVSAEMARLGETPDADHRAFEALARNVRDFGKLYERVRDYIACKDGAEQRDFLERVAVPEVGRFLRLDNYYTADFEESYKEGEADEKDGSDEVVPLRDLIELPTLNVDVLMGLKRSLTGRSFVHTPDVAAKWESERASDFKCVKGVFENPNLIINEESLQHFRFDFLREKNFLELRLVFVNAGKQDEKSLYRNFTSWLDWLRENKKFQRDVMKKVSFRVLTAAQRKAHSETLRNLRLGGPSHPLHVPYAVRVPYDAYWSFETHSGLPISFIGWLDNKHADNTRNLDLRSARERSHQFNLLWKDLNAGR